MSIGKTLFSGGNANPIVQGFGKTRFEMFFNRAAVTSAFDKKELTVLRRTGGFGRQKIRRSIRPGGKKGKKSAPGEPPRYHERGFVSLKDGVYFFADLNLGTVIIGPNKLTTKVRPMGKASGAQMLEEGGAGQIVSYRHNKRRPARSKRKSRIGHWRARPFIEPARAPIKAKMLELIKIVPV